MAAGVNKRPEVVIGTEMNERDESENTVDTIHDIDSLSVSPCF